MSAKSQPTPTGSTSPAAFRQGNSVELLFEPTGDLEKDYCAYCEIEDKNDRDDIIEGIIREELDPLTGLPYGASGGGVGGAYAIASAHSTNTSAPAPTSGLAATLNMNNNSVMMSANEHSQYDSPHSASQHYGALSGGPGSSASLTQQSGNCSPHSATNNSNNANVTNTNANMAPIVRTTVNLRNLSYCLNKRDMQPLADAIPHCPSLTAVRMTGCGLTEHSYKQLVEAVYKSASIHTLAVDLNPDGLFKDPTVTRKGDRNDVYVYASEYRGAHLRSAEEREDGAGGIGGHSSGAAAGGAGVGGAGAAGAKRAPPKPSRPAATTKKNVDKLSAEAADRTPIPLPTGWHAALLTGIQVLSLRGNGITDAQLEPLCALLSTNTELMSLSLWGNRITSVGAAMLAKALASNGKLVTLNLGHNLLDDEAVVALMGAFLTRDVPYEEMCRYRSGAHALLAASVEKSAAEGAVAGAKPSGAASGAQSSAAAAGGGAVGGVQLPPAEPPLFPTYGDIAASAIAKQIEEGTIATIKALGVPISATTGQAPTTKKKEAPAIGGGKRKGAGEGPVERPTDPYDDNVVRLLEDPIASPATTSLIVQQLYTAMTSSSAAAAQASVVQLQQLSQFRVPGNTALAALNLSFNPNITADGIAYAVSVLRSRPPTAEALYQQLTQGAVGMEFAPIASATSPSNINAKGAPATPSATIFGAPITAAIPTLAGHQGLNAPAANASVVAAQMQTAIMSAPHLHTLSKTCPHHMVDCCTLRQLDIESSKINPVVLSQLQQAVQERRTFAAEKRLAAERGGAGTPGQGLE